MNNITIYTIYIVLHIAYGVYAFERTDTYHKNENARLYLWFFIIASPTILIYRAIYGIFKKYK